MIKTKVPIASTAIATLRNLFFSFFISNRLENFKQLTISSIIIYNVINIKKDVITLKLIKIQAITATTTAIATPSNLNLSAFLLIIDQINSKNLK